MSGYFMQDVDAFFGTEAAELEFGGKPRGLRLWRHLIPQLCLNPGLLAVALYRASRWFKVRGLEIPSRLIDRFNEAVNGIQITGLTDLGPGLQIHHPSGIVLSPLMRSGRNLTLLGAAVTTGLRDVTGDPYEQWVRIGDNVTVATGAKLLGPLTIGDNAHIGPNVVLMQDVPAGAVVIVGARPKVIVREAD
jgi:serine O-acetyltransferase